MSSDDDVEILEVQDNVFDKFANLIKETRFHFDKLKSNGQCHKHESCVILDPIQTSNRTINSYCLTEEELKHIKPIATIDPGEKKRILLVLDELMEKWSVLIVNFRQLIEDNSENPKQLQKLGHLLNIELVQESKFIFRAPAADKLIVIILNNLSMFDETVMNELFTIWELRIVEILNNPKKYPIGKSTICDIEFYFGKFLLRKLTSDESPLDTKKLEKSLTENYHELKSYTENLIK